MVAIAICQSVNRSRSDAAHTTALARDSLGIVAVIFLLVLPANAALCIGFTIEITFHKLFVQNACERVALQLYRSTDAMEALGGKGDAAAASVAEHETINDPSANTNRLSDTLLKLRSLNSRKDLVWHV